MLCKIKDNKDLEGIEQLKYINERQELCVSLLAQNNCCFCSEDTKESIKITKPSKEMRDFLFEHVENYDDSDEVELPLDYFSADRKERIRKICNDNEQQKSPAGRRERKAENSKPADQAAGRKTKAAKSDAPNQSQGAKPKEYAGDWENDRSKGDRLEELFAAHDDSGASGGDYQDNVDYQDDKETECKKAKPPAPTPPSTILNEAQEQAALCSAYTEASASK